MPAIRLWGRLAIVMQRAMNPSAPDSFASFASISSARVIRTSIDSGTRRLRFAVSSRSRPGRYVPACVRLDVSALLPAPGVFLVNRHRLA